ncbi:MAG: ribosomal subunit interface protein [Ignavibacteria bacterium GWB2_35_6b]|nr:MAG: ribosomal subunit interface protein [Ignavibacteria bacterium GWB2_35_6b]
MNIQITSRKFRAKDSLKLFISDEIKSLERFNDQIREANVILSFMHQKDSIKTAEINLKLPGKTLSVNETSDDFFKSVTSASGKLARQLKKIKTKKISKKR